MYTHETWVRGNKGVKESITFTVEATDSEVEPTGIVEISIELLHEILKDLGYFQDS